MLLASALPLAAQSVQNPPQSFAAASGGVFASTSGPAQSQFSQMGATGCPVSLKAQHKADGSLVRTGSAHPKVTHGVGQWLQLTIENRRSSPVFRTAEELYSRRIAQAVVTVHGFGDRPRITQAAAGNSADEATTVIVTFSKISDDSSAAEVWVPGMTAVEAIDLNTVVYAGGGSSSFIGQTCRIVPDPFMLVAGK